MFRFKIHFPLWALGYTLLLIFHCVAQVKSTAADEGPSESSDFIIGAFLKDKDQENPHAQDRDVQAKQGKSDVPRYDGMPPKTALSGDAVDMIWKIIDANQDNRATDREVAKSVRGVRAVANHKESTPVRESIRAQFDIDKSGSLEKKEAIALVCEVRGLRCPTAALARTYWESLDDDNSKTVSSEEFASRIEPLGKAGQAMAGMLSNTLKEIDRDDSHAVDEQELYYSANTIRRIQLATEGTRIAYRQPKYWLKFVVFVANLDEDADNLVSRQECASLPGLRPHFQKIDKNRDTRMSASELCDYREHIDHLIAAARAARFSGCG
jgi:Ca2+-binding EF-hand superfamily protein